MIIPDKCFWVKEKLNSRENRVLNFKVFHDQNIWNIVYWSCNRFEERLAVSELSVWCRIIIMYLLLMIKSSRSFILKALQGPLTKWYLSRATGEPSYWACGSNSSKVFAAPEIAIPVWADATTKPFYLYKVEVLTEPRELVLSKQQNWVRLFHRSGCIGIWAVVDEICIQVLIQSHPLWTIWDC